MSKHRLDDAGLKDFLVATEHGPREPLSDWWSSFKYRFTPEQLHELGLEVRRGRGLIEESVHEIKRLTKERNEARAEVGRLRGRIRAAMALKTLGEARSCLRAGLAEEEESDG